MFSSLLFCASLATAGTENADKLLTVQPLVYGVGFMLRYPSGWSFAHCKCSSFTEAVLGCDMQEQRFHIFLDCLFHRK